MKRFTSKTQKIGEIGEDVACRFLVKHGFEVIERNYTKKWGEIDIVAKKAKRLHFCEVKTVSWRNPASARPNDDSVGRVSRHGGSTQETPVPEHRRTRVNKLGSRHGSLEQGTASDIYCPEEKVDFQKLIKIERAIKTYLGERRVSRETDWQIDIVTVLLDLENKQARVEIIDDVVI